MHREDQFIPELIVHNGLAALDFSKRVFGAEELNRMMKPGSEKLMHGELILDGHKFFVCDEFPASEGGTCKSSETLGGTGVRITLLVDDADRVVARAGPEGQKRIGHEVDCPAVRVGNRCQDGVFANQRSNVRLMHVNRLGPSPDAQVDHFHKH